MKYTKQAQANGITEVFKNGEFFGRYLNDELADYSIECEETQDGVTRCSTCETPLDNCESYQGSGDCQTCWYTAEAN